MILPFCDAMSPVTKGEKTAKERSYRLPGRLTYLQMDVPLFVQDVVEACKKKPNACVKEFSKERKAAAKEVIVACKKGDRSTAYQAWRNLATICWHCHIGFPVPYHDRYAQNRTKFHHAQYPGIDVKTKPDRIDPTNPVCANCHAK
jgi:hypothetical protein